MYVRSAGLGRYRRRGFGDGEKMGPPVDPNMPIPEPDVQQQIADLWDRLFAVQQQPASSTPVSSGSFSDFVNANAGKIALAGVAMFAFALAVKR
jgi:hypothetical protein